MMALPNPVADAASRFAEWLCVSHAGASYTSEEIRALYWTFRADHRLEHISANAVLAALRETPGVKVTRVRTSPGSDNKVLRYVIRRAA